MSLFIRPDSNRACLHFHTAASNCLKKINIESLLIVRQHSDRVFVTCRAFSELALTVCGADRQKVSSAVCHFTTSARRANKFLWIFCCSQQHFSWTQEHSGSLANSHQALLNTKLLYSPLTLIVFCQANQPWSCHVFNYASALILFFIKISCMIWKKSVCLIWKCKVRQKPKIQNVKLSV